MSESEGQRGNWLQRTRRGCVAHIDRFVESFTWKIVNNPLTVTSYSLGAMLGVTVLLVAVNEHSYSGSSTYDWYISKDQNVINMDMLNDATDRVDTVLDGNNTERTDSEYSMQFMYKLNGCNSGDIFTPARVQAMCLTESILFNATGFQDYCLADPTGGCEMPLSITTLFYGSSHHFQCEMLNQSTVTTGADFLYDKLQTTSGQLEYGFFVDEDAPTDGDTCYTRSLFQFGTPLAGYDTVSAVGDSQYEKVQKWLKTVEEDLWNHFDMKPGFMRSVYMNRAQTNGMDVLWISFLLRDPEMKRVVQQDMGMAMFSIIFVWCFIMLHVRSIFIGSLGMLQIVLSLSVSLFVYRIVFQIEYFDTMQSLALFVILGVGADDIFVMMDAWRQSEKEIPVERPPTETQLTTREPLNCCSCCPCTCCFLGVNLADQDRAAHTDWLHRRLMYAYSRAMKAVFNTSFTTAMAFFATAVSPIMPISTFGIYAALCIIANYVFVLTLTPATIIAQEVYMSTWPRFRKSLASSAFCCCFPYDFPPPAFGSVAPDPAEGASQKEESKQEAAGAAAKWEEMSEMAEVSGGGKLAPPTPFGAGEQETAAAAKWAEMGEMAEVSGGGNLAPPTPFGAGESVNSRAVAYEPMMVGVDAAGAEPAREYRKNYFLEILKIQVGGVKILALLFVVTLGAYASFSAYNAAQLAPPTEQEQWFPTEHMFERVGEVSGKFLSQEDDDYAKLYLVYGIRGIDRSNYNIYIPGKNRGSAKFYGAFDLQPTDAQNAFLDACESMRTYGCDEEGCQYGLLVRPNTTMCFLEEFQTWHRHNYNGTTTYEVDSSTFYSRLETFRDTESPKLDSGATWADQIGLIDGELKFASIEATMTMRSQMTVAIKRPIYQLCQDFAKSVTTTDTLQRPFQYTLDWVWYATEEGLLVGLMLGMAIAFPVALLTLSMATQNLVIALFAIMTIGCVVACVLGACRAFLDWDLGIAESVAGVIVIGLAVDYTIHMGHMYDHARVEVNEQRREGRVAFSIETMGFTVFAGAMTTAGSGMFLLPTQLLFFGKMAVLILFTIFFSVLYSFGFFLSLCYLIGPEDDQGSIPAIIGALSPTRKAYAALSFSPKATPTNSKTVAEHASNAVIVALPGPGESEL